jgi:hypothetical protein
MSATVRAIKNTKLLNRFIYYLHFYRATRIATARVTNMSGASSAHSV